MNSDYYMYPNFEEAHRLYPIVLKVLRDYEVYIDTYGDEDLVVYKEMKRRLSALTNKDLSSFSLYESWEAEGIEVLSFKIALPLPLKVSDVTVLELTKLIDRLQNLQIYDRSLNTQSFDEQFEIYTDEFYHDFLRLNFVSYNYQKLFGRQRDGSWFTTEQIVQLLLGKGDSK